MKGINKGVKNGMYGKKPWNKGIPVSEEIKKKMRIKLKGRKVWNQGLSVRLNPKGEFKKGFTPWNKGRKGELVAWNKGKHHEAIVGEKNVNWKGGITTEVMKIRHSIECKLWRKSVFERDNFTCQKYGTIGGILRAHHINNFADYPELRTSIENGITLSDKAHREFHKKYGNKNNTKEQLIEFLNTENYSEN